MFTATSLGEQAGRARAMSPRMARLMIGLFADRRYVIRMLPLPLSWKRLAEFTRGAIDRQARCQACRWVHRATGGMGDLRDAKGRMGCRGTTGRAKGPGRDGQDTRRLQRRTARGHWQLRRSSNVRPASYGQTV